MPIKNCTLTLNLGDVMDSVSGKYTQGAELLSASMSQSQQKQQGQMAVALIDAAGAPSSAAAPTPAPTANLGNHVNIKA